MLDQENIVPEENSKSTNEENSVTPENSDKKETEIAKETSPETVKEVLKIENVAPEVKLIENKAVEEIENKIAESSEEVDHSPAEMQDYSKFTLEDLVEELGKLVKEGKVQSINNNVNKIKSIFNVKFGALLKKEKEKFLAEGGNTIDFHYENPLKSTYNSYLYDYKIKKKAFFEGQEKQLKDNLEIKTQIIEELKHLIETADDGAVMYKTFKDIQTKWNQTGPIPRAKYNDIWKTYQHHVERFYDLLHISNDLRDLDFKHNLEEKLKLIEKAETLAELEDINVAFKELQVLHKLWKEDVGPVAREHREQVWERFSEATKKVHDKRHDFFKDLKSKYEENIDVKLEIVAKIAAVDTSNNKTRADWQKSIKEIETLRDEFFKSGQVPRAKSDKIWAKFKEATRKFNVEKNKYFKDVKREHLDNLNKKKLLIEQANSLKESDDWEMTTEVMKKIQGDWKEIGHVPRKYSDKLWKEFKDACNHYFDRLHQNQDAGNKEQLEVFNKKKELLKSIKEDVVEGDEDVTIDTLKGYVDEWRSLGRVPYEMKHIEVKFNKLIDKIVDENDDIDKPDIEMIKFTNLINSYLEQNNYRKLDSEQLFIRKKIDETVRDIQQLENNLGFISNVKDDNPLVINVRNQIASHQEKIDVWKEKLQYLRGLEY